MELGVRTWTYQFARGLSSGARLDFEELRERVDAQFLMQNFKAMMRMVGSELLWRQYILQVYADHWSRT